MNITSISIFGSVGRYSYDHPSLPESVGHITDILHAYDPRIGQGAGVSFDIDAANICPLIDRSHRAQFDDLKYIDAKIHLGQWQQAIDQYPGLILHLIIR